jgi:sec-independent protein translocase protein TatA
MVGVQEIALLVGLALLLFGPQKIPELAQAFGKAHAQYKKGLQDVKTSLTDGGSGDGDPALTPEEMEIIKAAKAKGIPTEHRSIEAISEDLLNS